MASITPRKNSNGIITSYTIKVFRGKDENGKQLKPFIRSYPDKKRGENIPSGWSQKKIDKEVQRIANLFEEECRQGKVALSKVKFSKYALDYLDMRYAEHSLKNSTLVSYKRFLDRINDVTLDGFGNLNIDEIKPLHLNRFYTSLLTKVTFCNGEKKLSSRTVNRYHRFISVVLQHAYMLGEIPENPCRRVKLPSEDQLNKKTEKDIINEEEINDVIAAIEFHDIKWRLFLYILFTTGARVGEVLGIKWCDIDFQNQSIHFKNNVQYRRDYKTEKYTLYVDSLKNGEDKKIAVAGYTISLFEQYAKEKKIINKNSDIFVFTQEDGETPMHPSAAQKICRRFNTLGIIKKPVSIKYFNHQSQREEEIKYKQGEVVRFTKLITSDDKAEYKVAVGSTDLNNYCFIPKENIELLPENIHPHKFRHTYASMLIFKGIDIVAVSKAMGHKQVSTTENTYAHLFKKIDERPANIIDDIIKEAKQSR